MVFTMIKELREDTDTKQETLAQILNIKQATYSKYELGEINFPIEALIKGAVRSAQPSLPFRKAPLFELISAYLKKAR